MAEGIFKHMLKDSEGSLKDVNVISAGTCAWEGDNAAPHAVKVLEEKDIDMKSHRSTPLTPKLIKEASLILTMTYNHKMAVLHMCPEAKEKVFTLKEYVSGKERKLPISELSLEGFDYDIKDPYGQDMQVYRQSATEIEENLQILIEKIK